MAEICRALSFILDSLDTYKSKLQAKVSFEFEYEDFVKAEHLEFYEKPLKALGLELKNKEIYSTSVARQSDESSKRLIEEFTALITGKSI